MPAHPDFLAAFDAALDGGALPPGLTAPQPDEIARRFAVYRNNVAVGLTEALAARFPVIRRLVGEVFFAALARAFAEAHRPRSPVLGVWGQDFAPWLEAFPPLAAYPYLGDVARIEFARGQAFHAADAPPIDPAGLADAEPDALCLHLHPSLILLRLTFPAVSIWQQNQPGAAPAPLPAGPETALILRDATFEVLVLATRPGDARLVEALASGLPLTQAADQARQAEPGHDPQPLLVRLMRAGAIVGPGA